MMRVSTAMLLAVSTMIAPAALAQTPKILVEEMMIPASDAGIEIYVRNKRPADIVSFRPERTVLYVHGATYPSSTAFDLQLGGMSWMDYIAAHGYDVYLLDLRGYGKSTRPKEMSDKPEANAPIVRGDTAVKDISTVVDFILKRRNIARLRFARLVVGYDPYGNLHDTKRSQGGTLSALRAGMDPQHAVISPGWPRTNSRLSHGAEGPSPGAMAYWRS
jgi:hypothetical protein